MRLTVDILISFIIVKITCQIIQKIVFMDQKGTSKSFLQSTGDLSQLKGGAKSVSESIKTSRNLLYKISETIFSNQNQYGLLGSSVFDKILQQQRKFYYTQTSLNSLTHHLLNYMAECHHRSLQRKKIKSKFFKQFGEKIEKTQNEVFFQNKNALNVISYLADSPEINECYLNLKFNLDPQETMAVAGRTRDLCKFDYRAFVFLSQYLYASCLNLEKQGKTIEQIEQALIKAIYSISSKYPPAPGLPDSKEINCHQSYKLTLQYKKIDLTKIDSQKRKESLVAFILAQATEASINYSKFVDLVQEVCTQKGIHFKIGVKIKDQSHKRAIQRVMQKMLDKSFTKYTINDFIQITRKQKSFSGFIQQQQNRYTIQMAEIYSKIKDPIVFKVSDMLRAKCLFRRIEDINECALILKKKISESQQCKLVELDNRLKGETRTSDIVLKILVGGTIAELQLPIEFNIGHNQFAHKIYQIVRSKFFSPLTMLKVINQELKNDYLNEINHIFKTNNNNSTERQQRQIYNLPQTFKGLQKRFQFFLKMVNFIPKSSNEAQSTVFNIQKLQFLNIVQDNMLLSLPKDEIIKIFKNNGQYFSSSNKHELSFLQFKKYLNIIEQGAQGEKQIQQIASISMSMGRQQQKQGDLKNSLIYYQKSISIAKDISKVQSMSLAEGYYNIGSAYQDKGDHEKALQFYSKNIQIIQRLKGHQSINCATTLNSMGIVYQEQGNYEKALQFYKKCLDIQQRVKGKDALDCASTLNNIGLVYKLKGNYETALEYYQKCLQIQQKVKGKQSIDCATTLYNIGSVYDNQGSYQKALQQYEKCLDIQERVKGKESIDCATTLNHIGIVYFNKGNDQKALQYYEKCLNIQERVKGKRSIDCASTLNNIGLLYKSKGNYAKTFEYYEKCLIIQEKVKGKDAIDCATTLNNIGLVYKSCGSNETSLQYFFKCLDIVERVKGKGSIDCALTLKNIGSVYYNQGKYDKALQYYGKNLQIVQNIKGKQTIDCTSTLNNIGSVYWKQGNYKMALQYYKQCLLIQEKIKGIQSIDCASTLNNIGSVYKYQGNYETAIQYYEKCLHMTQIFKGKQSINCATVLNNIGSLYDSQENYQFALQYYQKCLNIQEKVKGKRSIDCAYTLNNIGSIYQSQKNSRKAFEYFCKSFVIFERVKGKGSIECALPLYNIGSVYIYQRNYQKALQFYEECLTIQEKIKGKKSFDCANTLNSIGCIYRQYGNIQKASTYFKQSSEIKEQLKNIKKGVMN